VAMILFAKIKIKINKRKENKENHTIEGTQ
jgi:hypothetical protein